MTTLFAQPYDITANGFFFETIEDYAEQAAALQNSSGDPVEELEIQFIDGSEIDAELADAWGLNQANVSAFIDAAEHWCDDEKLRYILAVGECGYTHAQFTSDCDGIDIDIYHMDSLRDLAMHFVDEGLLGDIPGRTQCYLDFDAIARDLGMDYTKTTIAGENLIYRCN